MCQHWLVEMVLVRPPLGSLDSIWNPLFSKQKPVRPQSKSGTSCEQTSVNKQWQCAIEWGGCNLSSNFQIWEINRKMQLLIIENKDFHEKLGLGKEALHGKSMPLAYGS